MAIVLIGLITTSLFMALWTLIRVARINDYQAEVEAVLGGAVDALGTVDYQPCPGTGGYEIYAQQGAASVGWPVSTVAVTRVRYWDPYVQDWSDTNPFSVDECSGTVFLSTERTMQLVEVTVTSPDGSYSGAVQTIVTDMRNRRLGDA